MIETNLSGESRDIVSGAVRALRRPCKHEIPFAVRSGRGICRDEYCRRAAVRAQQAGSHLHGPDERTRPADSGGQAAPVRGTPEGASGGRSAFSAHRQQL